MHRTTEREREYPQGPTEEQVDMQATVPQHFNREGTKIEDLAGTGEQDAPGG